METSYWTARIDSEHGGDNTRVLYAVGRWMRLGFVGASALAIGLIMMFGDEARPLLGAAIAAAGGAVAAYSWRRAWTILDRIDEPKAPVAAATRNSGDKIEVAGVNQLGHA